MTMLTTSRLFLLPLSKAMVIARLSSDDFTLTCATPEGPRVVHFGPEWPGGVLGIYPFFAKDPSDYVRGSYAVIDHASGEAVGQLGTKGWIDDAGAVEIGYGMNESAWGRGIATEAVQAFVAHLSQTPGLVSITAQTAVENRASQRVLRKCGFEQRNLPDTDREDGLLDWALDATPNNA